MLVQDLKEGRLVKKSHWLWWVLDILFAFFVAVAFANNQVKIVVNVRS